MVTAAMAVGFTMASLSMTITARVASAETEDRGDAGQLCLLPVADLRQTAVMAARAIQGKLV